MSCDTACFEATIESCNNIVVRAAFPPNYPLFWIISKASSSNQYQRVVTTNGQGDLLISKTLLPAGFLLKGNQYKIILKNGTDYLQPVTFMFGGKQYSCIIAGLVNFDRDNGDNSEVNVIEFKQAIIPGGSPGDTDIDAIVYPFVNQTSFTYTHNLGRIVDVTIYDLAGQLISATVTDDTVNHNYIIITFTSPTSGRLLIQ